MTVGKILIVDDEAQIRGAVRRALADEARELLEAGSAREAVEVAVAEKPDVIVLDVALPDRSGSWVCGEIRKWSAAPILVLSARDSEDEKISLLEAGADDYVTKPFGSRELRARVRAQVRRARLAETYDTSGVTTVHDLIIDSAKRTVRRGGTDVHLTPTEWQLLRTFLKHAGRTLTHQQLFRAVWTTSEGDPQQYLRVYVANLRRKLEPDPVRPQLIITEPGVGYRFDPQG